MDGEELRRRRRALGMSQAELGEHLDVPQNTMSRWELGAVRIERPRMLALALRALERETEHADSDGTDDR